VSDYQGYVSLETDVGLETQTGLQDYGLGLEGGGLGLEHSDLINIPADYLIIW